MELRFTEFPPRSEVKRAISPSYRTREPVVANAALIPARTRQEMSAAWDARFVPERPVSLHRLTDCYVVGEGLVFDRSLAVLRPSLAQHEAAEVSSGLANLADALRSEAVPSLASAVLCCKRGAANYFHWVVEMLPMAHMSLRWQVPDRAEFLIPAGRLEGVAREAMGLLGVAPARLRPCWDPVHVDELFMVTGLTSHGTTVSPLALEAFDAVGADIRPGPFEQVWVSREDSVRRLLDETELCRALHARGWTVAAPVLFSFAEQIALFKGARRVAGVCGAGLANLVFAPRGAEIVSFAPANMPETIFWVLCELGGKRFREIRAPLQDGKRGIEPWDGAIVLSLPEVLAELG